MAKVLSFSVYDTMTSQPFSGNATPVFILDQLDGWIPDMAMQLIARELNHSETVFVRRRAGATVPNNYDIRFFAPYAEEPFCGHGITGAAHALHLATGLTRFHFSTREGVEAAASVATRSRTWANDEEPVCVSLRVPSWPMVVDQRLLGPGVGADLAAALGIEEVEIVQVGMNDLGDLIVELSPDVDFSAAEMDIDPVALLRASPPSTRSQVITSAWDIDAGVDFAKRVFAYGVEDQATGSTYCALVPYWGERLQKTELRAVQPSLRGGAADLRWDEDSAGVIITSESVKSVDGRIRVPDRGQVRSDAAARL